MSPTRIVLTVEHQLHAQLLKHAFANCPDVELVGEATDVIDCLRLIAAKTPDLWIHSWDEGPELTAVLSHIYSAHPDLSVIRICLNEPAGYIQMQIKSLADLLKFVTHSRHLQESA